jgi:Tfp pilus assembly protein PilZ
VERAGSGTDGERDDPQRVELALELASVRELYGGLAPSLGTDGIFIELDEPEKPGTVVFFQITLPDGVVVLEGEGSVLWSRSPADDRGPAGVAVRFTRLAPTARETIDAVIDAHLAGGGELFDLDEVAGAGDVYPTDALVGRPPHLGPGRWRRRRPEDERERPGSGGRPSLLHSATEADSIDLRFEEVLHGLVPQPEDRDDPGSQALDEAIAMTVSAPAASSGAGGSEPVADDWQPDGVQEAGGAEEIPGILEHWKREIDSGVEDLARLAGAQRARPSPNPHPTALERLPFDTDTPEELDTRPVSPADLSRGRRAAQQPEGRPWVWWLVGAVAVAVMAAALILLWPGARPPAGQQQAAAYSIDEAAVPGAGDTREPVDAAGESVPEPLPAEADPVPEISGPASRIRSIDWRTLQGATEVVIDANGTVDSSRVDLLRLDEPPRILVRVRGIDTPYTPYRVDVGSPDVFAIRIGHHPELQPPTLYVVLDTVSAAVAVAESSVEGSTVRLVVARADGG